MANCTCECRETPQPVPYIVYEAALSHAERMIKRLCILIGVQSAVIVLAIFTLWLGR